MLKTPITTRLTLALYLASLALLPWSWFPPFPWLSEHAQWSDVVFAAAAIAWAVASVITSVAEKRQAGEWPRPRLIHAALAFYLVWAALSLLLASPVRQAGALKLLGMAELCALVVITSDLASRPGMRRAIAWVVAITSLLTVVAAIAGLVLFHAGVKTQLLGSYGDLVEAKGYARVQAGLYHPNLLASYCIFAFSVVSRERDSLPRWLWRAVWIGLCVTVALTFSRAMLGFGLAMAIGAARNGIRRWIAWIYASAAVALIVALTVWNLSLDPTDPLAMRVNTAEPASRWETMISSLRTLAAHPLWGSGLGTSPGFHRNTPFDAHLTLLNIAATMGLPAMLAFVSIVILLWRNRSRPTDLALWGGMAGLALDSLAADIEEFRHVWVLFGLADCAQSEKARMETASNGRE